MEGHPGSWFEGALRQAGVDTGRLARADSPRRPVVERNNPWKDSEGISDAAAVLDAALDQLRGPGKILFVSDVEDDPIARVQAAVRLSRAAVARDMDVLLVDADVRHVGLSRWLPDRDLDAEGLVDVLQYGASIAAARRRSEVDGIDILGVGSYRPDLAAIYGDDDLRRLHAQLRVSAGLVVVVGPSLVEGRRFNPLARLCDATVLSVHLDAGLAGELAEFAGHLRACGRPIVGAFTWAGPGDSDRFVDDALLERSRALPRATADSPFPGRGPVSGVQEEALWNAGEPAASPRTAEPADDSGEGPRSVRISTERPRPGRSRSSSSGSVRAAAIVIGAAIVAFLGWWIFTWQSVEPTPQRPRIQPHPTQTQVASEDATPAETPGGDAGTQDPAHSGDAVAVDQGPSSSGTEAQVVEDAGETGVPQAPVETSRAADELLAQPVETALEDVHEDEDPFEAGLARAGASGWGLYVNSFASRTEAETERARVEGQGYSAVVREATVRGQLWYRVVIGEFATKAEAAGFLEQAKEKFHADWVGVVKK